MILWVI